MFDVLIAIAAVCYIMARRVAGEPAEGKRMLLLPAVLAAIGLSDVSGAAHNSSAVVFLVVTTGVSVAFGALRGRSVRLSEQHGIAYVHYTWITIVLWVLNLALKFGLNLGFKGVDPHAASAAGNSLLLTLGIGMIVEGVVTLSRASNTTSRVLWSKGKDGKQDTTSPYLDKLQDRRSRR